MATEMGAIANMLEQQDDSETPLKKKLNSAGKILTFVGLIICAAIFSIGLLYGRPLLPQFLVAICWTFQLFQKDYLLLQVSLWH